MVYYVNTSAIDLIILRALLSCLRQFRLNTKVTKVFCTNSRRANFLLIVFFSSSFMLPSPSLKSLLDFV